MSAFYADVIFHISRLTGVKFHITHSVNTGSGVRLHAEPRGPFGQTGFPLVTPACERPPPSAHRTRAGAPC
jgi:hypothetical protein